MTRDCIELLACYITIIGLPLTVIGIIIGIIQIRFSKRIEEARLWIDLREVFRNHNDVHLKLRNGGKWTKGDNGPENEEDWANVDAYLGQFELCQVMLSRKLISKNIFKSQYDYRLYNIIKNAKIKDKILKEKDDWQSFISLCKDFNYKIE